MKGNDFIEEKDYQEVRLSGKDKERIRLEKQMNDGTDIMEMIDRTGEDFIDLMGKLTGKTCRN